MGKTFRCHICGGRIEGGESYSTLPRAHAECHNIYVQVGQKRVHDNPVEWAARRAIVICAASADIKVARKERALIALNVSNKIQKEVRDLIETAVKTEARNI